jgi:tetraprenyl-beta-curcumene synthase
MYTLKFIRPFQQSKLIYQYVKNVFPVVKKELYFWKRYANQIPDTMLSDQAIQSIEKKTFHAQGGAVYSLYYHRINLELIKFIVSLQTISDYLDNLCDRVGIEDDHAFLQLHHAITDALTPNDSFHDYYAFYPYKEDGNYLYALVNTCKQYIRTLPSYEVVYEEIIFLGKLYSEMQSYKHTALNHREQALCHWAQPYINRYPDLSVWEFSAAAGSTLGIFLLCTIGEKQTITKKDIKLLMDAYFPWICGLHILLDYLIDEKEDLIADDLNFVSYYSNDNIKKERFIWFLNQCQNKVKHLPNSFFHTTVLEGLLALYLSDPKSLDHTINPICKSLLKNSSYTTSTLHTICKWLRRKKAIDYL